MCCEQGDSFLLRKAMALHFVCVTCGCKLPGLNQPSSGMHIIFIAGLCTCERTNTRVSVCFARLSLDLRTDFFLLCEHDVCMHITKKAVCDVHRLALIFSLVCEQDVYMLITTSTINRWKSDGPTVRQIAESFTAYATPKRSSTV